MIPEDFYLENRYYYKRLNRGEKDLYRFLVELFLQRKREFIFTFSDSWVADVPEAKDIPIFVYIDYEEFVDLYKTYEYIMWDCPEFYYLSQDVFDFDMETGIHRIGGKNPFYTVEEIDKLDKLLYGILHNFDHIIDPFELELEVHDYITRNFDYDPKAHGVERLGERDFEEMFTIAGFLKTGKAVCAAFSRLMQFVLLRRGIEAAYVIADAGSEEDGIESHAWLVVKLGGHYYHLDVTFNEGGTLETQSTQYEHFNVPTEEILDDHFFKAEEYPDIICDHTEYNYYNMLGLYFETYEQIIKGLEKHLDSLNLVHGQTYNFYFKYSRELDLQKIVRSLWKGMENKRVELVNQEFSHGGFDGYYVLEFVFDKFLPDRNGTNQP